MVEDNRDEQDDFLQNQGHHNSPGPSSSRPTETALPISRYLRRGTHEWVNASSQTDRHVPVEQNDHRNAKSRRSENSGDCKPEMRVLLLRSLALSLPTFHSRPTVRYTRMDFPLMTAGGDLMALRHFQPNTLPNRIYGLSSCHFRTHKTSPQHCPSNDWQDRSTRASTNQQSRLVSSAYFPTRLF